VSGRERSRSSSCELSGIGLVFRVQSWTVREPPAPEADRARPNHR
jgi:hypothetical protein